MSFIKYPGGKKGELNIIKQYLPPAIANYYEPFVGGGAVYFDLKIDRSYINDKSDELIYLYHAVKDQRVHFFKTLAFIKQSWELIENTLNANSTLLSSVYIKYRDGILTDEEMKYCCFGFLDEHRIETTKRIAEEIEFNKNDDNFYIKTYLTKKFQAMKVLEQTKRHLPESDILPNIESGFKAGLYMYIRALYNVIRLKKDFLMTEDNANAYKGILAALYVFIRETAYSSMFRFNRNGEFNVPYGGISYNKKSFEDKIAYYKNAGLIKKLNNTVIENLDFEDFLELYPPAENDFIFVDPPYDSEFSEYDNASFCQKEQIRLADYLINKCKGNFMLIIKNTEFISSLYKEKTVCSNGKELNITQFDKKYNVSFMNRNEKAVTHLLIKNY